MGAYLVDRSALVNRAVQMNDVVIPNLGPALFAMPTVDVVDRAVFTVGSVAAVDK